MIEINLLPEELRRKKTLFEIPSIKAKSIFMRIVGIIICIQLILSVIFVVKKYNMNTLEAEWVLLKPEKERLLNLKRQVNILNNKIKDIEALTGERILWAKKLNELSDSMIPGVWFTDLSLEEKTGKKYLSLKGNISSFGRDEAALIGRFMKGLKENTGFFEDFSEMELGTMQQRKVENIEVMQFSINCYFRKR